MAAAVLGAAAATPASAATTPPPTPSATTKTPTLPVPKATVTPELSVGGSALASMGVVTDLPAGVPAPPRLRDVSWVLVDLGTGDVVAAKAAHARLLPASTLKLLTALVLLPKVPADSVVRAAASDTAADGTRVGLQTGKPYTGRQLFQALLMASGNDAAYALARAGGGREAVLDEMNARAAHLGAHDTVAKDPSGLDAPGQTSSAYDLALIGRAALQIKDFRSYVTTRQVPFPGKLDPKTKKRSTFMIANHNKLLYNYPGTIGLKNGYTEAAHRTYVSAVTRGGRTYLLSEMYGLDGSWHEQAAMYDWAFRYAAKARPVGRLVEPGEVPAPPTPAVTQAGPATAAPAPADTRPAAASTTAAAVPALPVSPWAGVVVLGGLGLVVGGGAARARRRRRRVSGA